MQEFYRNIICDKCGKASGNSDVIADYKVVTYLGRHYDLCPMCNISLRSKMQDYELAVVESFVYPEGRDV